jgi:hypothetical protein
MLIWVNGEGMDLGVWEGYGDTEAKEELKNRVTEDEERFSRLLDKKFPKGSYAQLGIARKGEKEFQLPDEAKELIHEIKNQTTPNWLFLGIIYPWNIVSSSEFLDTIQNHIKSPLSHFWLASPPFV